MMKVCLPFKTFLVRYIRRSLCEQGYLVRAMTERDAIIKVTTAFDCSHYKVLCGELATEYEISSPYKLPFPITLVPDKPPAGCKYNTDKPLDEDAQLYSVLRKFGDEDIDWPYAKPWTYHPCYIREWNVFAVYAGKDCIVAWFDDKSVYTLPVQMDPSGARRFLEMLPSDFNETTALEMGFK